MLLMAWLHSVIKHAGTLAWHAQSATGFRPRRNSPSWTPLSFGSHLAAEAHAKRLLADPSSAPPPAGCMTCMDGTRVLLQSAIPCTVANLWTGACCSPGNPLTDNTRVAAQSLLTDVTKMQHSKTLCLPCYAVQPSAPDSPPNASKMQHCQTYVRTAAEQDPWAQGPGWGVL